MALVSMTGFGRGAASSGGIKVEVELSSVNRKQFDVHVSLPRTLFALEAQVNSLIHASVLRGCVTGVVKVTATGKAREQGVLVDGGAAAAYVRSLRSTARRLGLKDDLTAATLVRLPEVLRYEDVSEDSARIWDLVERALKPALKGLAAMRRREGVALEADVRRRLGRLTTTLAAIKQRAPHVAKKYAAALRQRMEAAGAEVAAGDAHALREIVLFADRADISEEIVRLESHFKQAAHLLRAKEPVGRTLDFLCQEMFREINTIGSKANDAPIARHVVTFKTDMEAIREQVQNVE